MADIVLTGKDYENLNIKYSDLNIVKNVYGQEYLITETDIQNFEVESGNLNLTDNDYVISNKTSIYPTAMRWQNPFGGEFWLRNEDLYMYGTCIASVKDVIYDTNSLSVLPQIKYRKYRMRDDNFSIINNSNYNSWSLLYENIRREEFAQQNESGYLFDTDTIIPYDKCEYGIQIIFAGIFGNVDTKTISVNPLQEIYNIKILSVSEEEGTIIQFDYRMLIWHGFNTGEIQTFGAFRENYWNLYVAKNIDFIVQGKSINTISNSFQYMTRDSQSFSTDESYTLETNELMQYRPNQITEDKLSYKVSAKILNGMDTNRQIISFNLLNVNKYNFETKNGSIDNRYLDVGDLIKIKDENDNWVGEYIDANGDSQISYFEIIKMQNKWNGSYYKEIVARQVDY